MSNELYRLYLLRVADKQHRQAYKQKFYALAYGQRQPLRLERL